MKITRMVLGIVFVGIMSGPVMADQWFEHTEDIVCEDVDIEFVDFENIDFTEFEYHGNDSVHTLNISVTYRVKADNRDIADEVFPEFNLDVNPSGNKVNVRLDHPKQPDSGNIFRRLLPHDWSKWEVIMTITGPSEAHLDLDADFSDVIIESINNGINLDSDFTDSILRTITGDLVASCEFGSLTVRDLAGTFQVKGEFSSIDLDVTRLDSDALLSIEFGNADLNIPSGTGATFSSSKSFGGIDFNLSEEVTLHNNNRNEMSLGDGGPEIELSASFGNIDVSDSARQRSSTSSHNTGNNDTMRVESTPVQKKPESRFTEGTINTVRFNGKMLLHHDTLADNLGIHAGQNYTRQQLDDAVSDLSNRNRFVDSAWYRIDNSGVMTVWIDEADLYDLDGDAVVSFNRVAGFGVGGELTFSSMVGPFSELGAKGIYNWGTEDWTYQASVEKRLFVRNELAIGGSYRKAYESAMDWAISSHDIDANSFVLGLELNNFYQVEGPSAFVSQSLGDWLTVKATYFNEDYSSIAKNTDWSLFNHKHTKAPNAPLDPLYTGTIEGMKYAVDFVTGNNITSTSLHIETERSLDKNTTIPAYTRYLGILNYRQQLYYHQALLVRMAGGYSDDVLPDQKAFRLGGVNTLRGYSYGLVPEPPAGLDGFEYHGGGSQMALANVEYVFGRWHDGILDDFGFSVFADAGGVWLAGEDITPEGIKGNLGIGFGFGGIFDPIDLFSTNVDDQFRINWAVPVGNVSHKSHWTVNFSRPF